LIPSKLFEGMTKESLRHGAAADIPGTDKKDGFHRQDDPRGMGAMETEWVSGFLKSIHGYNATE
jgi:hypothetical protein